MTNPSGIKRQSIIDCSSNYILNYFTYKHKIYSHKGLLLVGDRVQRRCLGTFAFAVGQAQNLHGPTHNGRVAQETMLGNTALYFF